MWTWLRRLIRWLLDWLKIQTEPTFGWQIPWHIPESSNEEK